MKLIQFLKFVIQNWSTFFYKHVKQKVSLTTNYKLQQGSLKNFADWADKELTFKIKFNNSVNEIMKII